VGDSAIDAAKELTVNETHGSYPETDFSFMQRPDKRRGGSLNRRLTGHFPAKSCVLDQVSLAILVLAGLAALVLT